MRHTIALLSLAIAAGAAAPARAADNPPPAQPALFQAVIDCKTVADPQARLACYDQSVDRLATAAAARDVLVVDRETARRTKRGLFGLSLPRIKLFGDNDDEEISQIESTISAVSDARDGMTVFVLADGSRWKQTEGRYQYPKPGQPIVIRRAALGSFMANVNKQSGVRVVRLPGSP